MTKRIYDELKPGLVDGDLEPALVARLLVDMLPKHDVYFGIEHNSHKLSYQNINVYIDTFDPGFCSYEDRYVSINKDELWIARWYPDNPLGSHHIAASSLELLLRELVRFRDLKE